VGGKLPNSFGLYDMLGNVNQWVADWYGRYNDRDIADPHAVESDVPAVAIRGATYRAEAQQVRVSARRGQWPQYIEGAGLRCVGQ
jgi:formylglycine-generating enzyme required for sulfatase activity